MEYRFGLVLRKQNENFNLTPTVSGEGMGGGGGGGGLISGGAPLFCPPPPPPPQKKNPYSFNHKVQSMFCAGN